MYIYKVKYHTLTAKSKTLVLATDKAHALDIFESYNSHIIIDSIDLIPTPILISLKTH